MQFVNWTLMKNPANWIIVWTMIAFGLMVIAFVSEAALPTHPPTLSQLVRVL